MNRTLSILILIAGLSMLAGCAAKNEPMADSSPEQNMEAKPMAKVEQASPAPSGPAVSAGRSASSQMPVEDTRGVAQGFPGCIDGIRGMGPVRLGMSVAQMQAAAPWLEVDPHNSSLLSTPIHTLCGERVWEYVVRFDADCRVSSIRFSGPQRVEQVFRNLCQARGEYEESILSPFKWRCTYSSSAFTVLTQERGRNIYTLIDDRVPESDGRCLLPTLWD